MASLLFITLVFAPILAPCAFVAAAVALARRVRRRLPGSGWHLPSVTTCALVAVMAGAAAFGAYAWGVMSGFYILDPDQMCAAWGVEGDHIVTRETLPVSAQCVTSDGMGTELVAGWVNPVIFTGLALLVLALMTGTVTGVRRLLSPAMTQRVVPLGPPGTRDENA
ncbi:hypothetical protein [Streptomyces sp. NBC_01565]|uniref:hypothetical protein n=1 Tax=Streptomyces sp. NBC_01565 TaxID=2975881 RepID=UPI002257E5C0|nr:hypothetical protein [Streptomyces sp. NBC_01565]MCX4546155.1 hypothetical protein [Streptomyces sp. NBC_01565]